MAQKGKFYESDTPTAAVQKQQQQQQQRHQHRNTINEEHEAAKRGNWGREKAVMLLYKPKLDFLKAARFGSRLSWTTFSSAV